MEYSDLSEEDKDKIAWSNASKLLSIDKPALYSEEESMLDEIASMVDSGLPLDNIFVIDAHTHLLDKEDTAASGSIMINGAEDILGLNMKHLIERCYS